MASSEATSGKADVVIVCLVDPAPAAHAVAALAHKRIWAPPADSEEPLPWRRALLWRWEGGSPGHAGKKAALSLPETEAADQAELTGMIARALKVKPAEDAVVAERMRKASQLSYAIEAMWFNDHNRLLEMIVRFDSPLIAMLDLSGEVYRTDGGPLPNGWVERPASSDESAVRLRVTAVLPPGVAPGLLRAEIAVDGIPVFPIDIPDDLDRQTAGLVSLEVVSGDEAVVEHWGSAEPRARCGSVHYGNAAVRPLAGGISFARTSVPWPLPATAIATGQSAGIGQAFRHLDTVGPFAQPSSPRLHAMKDKFAGETAWLIGNGPSVRIEDLDRLEGRLCFAFNRFYLAYGDTRLRPQFTISGDRQMIEDFGDEMLERSGGTLCFAQDEPPELTGDYCWLRQVIGFPSLFSKNAAARVTPGGSSVYVAMQVAYWLGIRNFYVYGADFTFAFDRNSKTGDSMRTATGDGNHFIKNYRSGKPWCPPAILNIMTSFLAARALIEGEGGFIRNATRGGALETFDRIDFDDALKRDAVGAEGSGAHRTDAR
ncbi:hypothetical protein [Parasphingopyxis marina]|uniref:DUF115 domain-containing protein n=1 Tax=Parasphingopyxis marina TaxID=2761622 RepID=A0A842HSI3_9SPHN|nr:hypothetical protein [Parasphingopyxis marina]MBC2776036.1 hypothetical protein [Parasphingopyxis marina]